MAEPTAAEYISKHVSKSTLKKSCRQLRKLEPGHLLFTEMIKRAIGRGDQRFDFLRGNEPYKEYWEAKPHGQKKLRMVGKRLLPRVIAKLVETSRQLIRR